MQSGDEAAVEMVPGGLLGMEPESLVQLCPLPKLGEDSYQNGYNRGFRAGLGPR